MEAHDAKVLTERVELLEYQSSVAVPSCSPRYATFAACCFQKYGSPCSSCRASHFFHFLPEYHAICADEMK
eukprot:833736-Pelagomonas_calceolata.AAC.2